VFLTLHYQKITSDIFVNWKNFRALPAHEVDTFHAQDSCLLYDFFPVSDPSLQARVLGLQLILLQCKSHSALGSSFTLPCNIPLWLGPRLSKYIIYL
jgi:hypothetical protein